MNILQEHCAALTGGIATGKSTVANMMSMLGAYIIDTDKIARQVVEPGNPVIDRIAREFGHAILNHDGTLNREAMRNEIICNPERRELLNSITHPEINKEVLRLVHQYSSESVLTPIIIDVPLLFEAGWHRLFRKIILVYLPVEIQIQRLMMRDGLSKDTAVLTLKAQMSIEEKKQLVTHIIDNSGSLENTKSQVDAVYKLLKL